MPIDMMASINGAGPTARDQKATWRVRAMPRQRNAVFQENRRDRDLLPGLAESGEVAELENGAGAAS